MDEEQKEKFGHLKNMSKTYINDKIKQCEDLIQKASSDAQANVYKKYFDFWLEASKLDFNSKKINIKEAKAAFNLKFPNKKSHYKRNDKLYRTKSFKEFLKSFE